ncbi:bifunctional DNA-formamidopyrimidine glycosylase/DNA-(apurinic or apyrimidinic site) lyase [Sporomusa sp. GT1]|uniref:bifunctional DNA-formamidopyrimidine glycosylase/DNA-(apurinic or apyrimidinic site) lyase n=1 Tax=Sporomusa sp. GT1 TaxID=1534747 RepID=UPI001CB7C777|nr:bifunctional DNA-formamidopyrimidine glycosylase/DNA-(apurinic or apyrimidinic site) lyase [Sporomusa sp. GT1]
MIQESHLRTQRSHCLSVAGNVKNEDTGERIDRELPEIPEIETVRRQLAQHVQGKIIETVMVNREKSLNVSVNNFIDTITGQQIIKVRRRAKQIILTLSNAHSLVVHFMLEGYVRIFYSRETVSGRPSVVFTLNSGDKMAFFKLTLGYIHLVPAVNFADIPELSGLGPEPLSPEFTPEEFLNLLSKRKGMIKPLLMDQAFLAGIGNVYSNETLFCSRIRPERKAAALTTTEKINLYHCIRDILTRAIELGGVNEDKFASDDILTGGFEPHLQVAYRTGLPCYVCRTSIETKRVGGRNAFYCPVCQR